MDQWGVVDGFRIAFITDWASPSSTTLAKPSLQAKLAAKRAVLDSALKDSPGHSSWDYAATMIDDLCSIIHNAHDSFGWLSGYVHSIWQRQ